MYIVSHVLTWCSVAIGSNNTTVCIFISIRKDMFFALSFSAVKGNGGQVLEHQEDAATL